MKTKAKKFLKILNKTLIIGFIFVFCTAIGLFSYYFAVTSNVRLDASALSLENENASVVLDINNNDVFSLGKSNSVKIKDLNDYTINAFIAMEDKRFYYHHGLDFHRMAGALVHNIKNGKLSEGGSTISQQLVKNTFLSQDKTIKRKLKEIKLTKELEKKFSKNEILELYLNSIYFGGGCYGISDASKYYFNKEAPNLSLAESAFLVAVINAPSLYNPQTNLDGAIKRKNLVLSEMKKDSIITKEEYEQALNETLNFVYFKPKNAFFNACAKEANSVLNLSENNLGSLGLKIYTCYNKNLQEQLEKIIKDEDILNCEENNNPFATIMVLDNSKQSVVAYASTNNASASSARRQAGSVLKPLAVYAPALENGKIYSSSLISDEAININGYKPQNADNKYHGYVSVKDALIKSLNIPAVKVMEMVSPAKSVDFLKGFNINLTNEDANLALSLGASQNGQTELELAGGYMALANNGQYSCPTFITKIEDKSGNILYEKPNNQTFACSSETAYLLTDILKQTTTSGTAKRIGDMGYSVASKTGTVGLSNSSENSDAYSISYTTSHTILSHIYSKDKPMPQRVNGATFPSVFNKLVLENLYTSSTPPDFIKPEGVVSKNIDTFIEETQHKIVLAPEGTPQNYVREELFNKNYLPPENIGYKTNEINVIVKENMPQISFFAKLDSSYKIYRNGEEIMQIWGNNENVNIIDHQAIKNNLLEYFVIETNYRNEQILSNTVKIFYV